MEKQSSVYSRRYAYITGLSYSRSIASTYSRDTPDVMPTASATPTPSFPVHGTPTPQQHQIIQEKFSNRNISPRTETSIPFLTVREFADLLLNHKNNLVTHTNYFTS